MAGIAKQLALRLTGPDAASLTCQDLASICWAFGRPRVRNPHRQGFLTLPALWARASRVHTSSLDVIGSDTGPPASNLAPPWRCAAAYRALRSGADGGASLDGSCLGSRWSRYCRYSWRARRPSCALFGLWLLEYTAGHSAACGACAALAPCALRCVIQACLAAISALVWPPGEAPGECLLQCSGL